MRQMPHRERGGRRVSARMGRSVRQLRLAAELKRFRELALLTADHVAQELGWSPSKISRIENARIRLKAEDVELLLRLYEVADDQWVSLLNLVEEGDRKGWWEAYADILPAELLTLISFEAEATVALNYEPMVVPGLLQTESYARRMIGMWRSINTLPPIELEQRLEVRRTRQHILSSSEPLKLSVVMDEAVLLRNIGGRPVMREQLQHLVDMSQLTNVILRILPLTGDHFIIAEPFMSLRIPDYGDIVCVENFFTSQLYTENATEIYHRTLIFEELQKVALGVEESIERIKRAARDVWTGA
jgi:transcriptional regulator with XRE-family HTH domain